MVAVYYRPPKRSSYFPANFDETLMIRLEKVQTSQKKSYSKEISTLTFKKRVNVKEFKELIRLYGFSQIIKQSNLGDQEMVGCIRKLNHAKFITKVITCRNYSAYEPEV